MPDRSGPPTARILFLSLAALAICLGLGAQPPLQAQEAHAQPLPPLRALAPVSYADVLEPALAAVVHVQARRGRSARPESVIPWFFRGGEDEPRRGSENQGSGVIVREDGIILTNSHVVAGAERVMVKLQDRRELVARVVGADAASDIAVIQIEDGRMPTIPFGSSADLRIGDVVFALGSPLGLDQTATMGIVSAKGRNVSITSYDSLIQTDAAINPGNSGGALIDARGTLVGINTAILFRGTPSFQGVGLAIPIDLARSVMDQILEQGHVVRAFLGVNLDDVDSNLAREFGLERPTGAVVTRVHADTPAAAAGLRAGDVILSVDEVEVATLGDLRLKISGRRPGDRVKLGVLREGARRTLTARLTTLDDDPPDSEPQRQPAEPQPEERWGLQIQELDGRLRDLLGLAEDLEGVVVAAVEEDSPASREGLEAGDVIVRIERMRCRSLDEARRLIAGAEGDTLLLLVRSGEATRFVVLEK